MLYAWTDLSDFPRKYFMFIGNRTSKMLESPSRQYLHNLKSEYNPADLASRGVPPSELLLANIWWCELHWLRKHARINQF